MAGCGHGWVYPNYENFPQSKKQSCGGPGHCSSCSSDLIEWLATKPPLVRQQPEIQIMLRLIVRQQDVK